MGRNARGTAQSELRNPPRIQILQPFFLRRDRAMTIAPALSIIASAVITRLKWLPVARPTGMYRGWAGSRPRRFPKPYARPRKISGSIASSRSGPRWFRASSKRITTIPVSSEERTHVSRPRGTSVSQSAQWRLHRLPGAPMFAFGKVDVATGQAATEQDGSDIRHLPQSPAVCQCAGSG